MKETILKRKEQKFKVTRRKNGTFARKRWIKTKKKLKYTFGFGKMRNNCNICRSKKNLKHVYENSIVDEKGSILDIMLCNSCFEHLKEYFTILDLQEMKKEEIF